MAICNRFNTLQSPTGNFLTFSQYTEDLTKSFVHKNTYKVIPSKFVALEMEYNLNNSSFPAFLETNFENGVAVAKNMSDYTPEISKNIFWNAMKDHIDGAIRWIGDINIHSHNTHDGMGYSEIYCYIPADAQSKRYNVNVDNEDAFTITSASHLEGYEGVTIDPLIAYYPTRTVELEEVEVDSSNLFNINTIVVLYDVVDDVQNTTLYSDIPMGIYLTGLIQNDGSVSNTFTKYVSSQDIYGAGTSYGLKICSRYIVGPQEASISVSANDDRDNAELSLALSNMSETVDKMNDILGRSLESAQKYKDLYALFKNSRTNVPYIKNVNGVDYWFVNGKMLNRSEMIEHECYELEASIQHNVQRVSNGVFSPVINWCVRSANGSRVQVSNVTINGESYVGETVTMSPIDLSSPSITDYNVSVEMNGNILSSTPYVRVVYPSYMGLMVDPANWTPNTDEERILESRQTEYKYTNTDLSKHVYFAYPKSFGRLISIKDARDIEYLGDFDYKEVNGYHLYWDKETAKVNNYTLKFS